ncbi:MAG: putative metal-binding motif-containing protein, partial [Myxococcota bacterium]
MLAFLLACAPDPEPEKGRDRCEIVIRYGDADGDGFGDVEAPVAGCDPAGVDDAGDCDDADPATHPGAQESCDQPVDRDCDGQIGFADDDGDGWAACEDCDDADPWVHPEAEEICDWIDQDCDALVDEDPMDGLAFYVDADGDGYGDDATLELACSEMADRVDEGGDCDDADPRVNPDEDERCDPDDVDEDCDGLSDESGADDEEQFWLDDDEDGYGDRGTWVFACDWPDGYVGNDEDCDDADGGVNPDATETCDGEDEDCDRLVDDDADGAPTWYFDDDGDGYGDATVTMLSCSAPRSDWVEDATDCDDADAATHPGADEACDGEDDDCD